MTIVGSKSVEIAEDGSTGWLSGVFNDTLGKGSGGNINISTPSLSLGEGGVIQASTYATGSGGTVHVKADELQTKGGDIRARTYGAGNAGNIELSGTNLSFTDGAQVGASAWEGSTGRGGNINITGRDVRLTHGGSIKADVGAGEGKGGNVTINASTLVLLEKSSITAKAAKGYGGDITIDAEATFFSDDSYLDASSEATGKDGKIKVTSPVLDITSYLVPLREAFLKADQLLLESCETRDPEEASSFIIDSGEGLPPGPDYLLR